MQTELCVMLYPKHVFEPKYFISQPEILKHYLSSLFLGSRNLPNIVKTDIFLCCRLQQPALFSVGKKINWKKPLPVLQQTYYYKEVWSILYSNADAQDFLA